VADEERELDPFEEFEEAVERLFRRLGEEGLLFDWVLVSHRLTPESDGSDTHMTGYVASLRQPNYRTQGLLKYALTIVDEEVRREVPDGDDDL